MIVPTLAEVTAGYRDTRFLLRLRWRMVRSTRNRVALFLGFGIFALVIYGAINTGTVVRNLASEGIGTAAGVYAVNYVIALDRGELGLIGATALGAALLAALFAPFTGGSVTALFPEDDLTGFRPARMHRYFDSLITTAISSIGFLQLIALTTVGSLLTIGGGRAEGILLVWAIWPILVFVTVAEEWLVELVHRSFGASMRRLIFGLLIFGVALAIMLDPNNGRTIFGLGDQFLAAIEAAADRNFTRVAVTLVVVAALCALLFLLGLIACRSALAKPAAVASVKQNRRLRIPQSTNPHVAVQQMLIAQAIRTTAIRRPLITILILGLPTAILVDSFNVMSTFVVAIPLTVGLSVGVNIFGVLGPAMPWLATMPGLMRSLFVQVIVFQAILITALLCMVWIPATIFGEVDTREVAAITAATIVSGLFTIRSSTDKSVNRPYLARLMNRGDMIAPPLTTIGYTIRLALWSGQLGVLTLTQDGAIRYALVLAAIGIVTVRMYQLHQQWAEPQRQSYIIHQVAAA